MVTGPSDRFVCRAHTSQQLILIPLTLCFGCSFPIDYGAGRVETGGEWWESGSVRACAVEVFSTLAGCGQLDHQFEFLSAVRLKFQPLKIEGNKRLGLSKQPLRVVFPHPFLIFPVPVPLPWPRLGSDRRWYDSKCDYVKIFYSKHGQKEKIPPQH